MVGVLVRQGYKGLIVKNVFCLKRPPAFALLLVVFWPCAVIQPVVWAAEATTAEERAAEATAPKEETKNGSPIHITSDRAKSNQKERWVEFIGNVKATQDDGVITADRLKIFYKPGGDKGGDASAAVERMVAQGNVRIVFDNKSKTALAEKAVFATDDKVLVLSGGDPTVWSGGDIIRGRKITLFQAENRTLVEGGDKEQVEATFHSQGEGGLIK
jgi:lipopolysaccharide export system protein LptA